MKRIPVAAVAVGVLWIALSTFWMAGTGATQGVALATNPQAAQQAPQSCAMMTSMRGGTDGNAAMMPGSGMASPSQSLMQGSKADSAAATPSLPSAQGIMTEPVAPVLGLQDLFQTPPPAGSDVMVRLQAVEDRLNAVLSRLESIDRSAVEAGATPGVDNQGSIQPTGSLGAKFLSVVASGPVIGFLLILLLAMAATTYGRSALLGVRVGVQRSPALQAAWHSARGQQFRAAAARKRDQAMIYLKSTGLDNPQGRAAQWTRLSAQARRVRQGVVTRLHPWLAHIALDRKRVSSGASAGAASPRRVYGDVIHGTDANGKPLQAGVFEEGQVRAAAGLTLALGALAFAYAFFGKIYGPIQFVTTLFFIEFLIRVTVGIRYSPMGMIAHWMTRRQTPQLVSARPKQFAWTLGLVMSLAMMIITNSGIRGPLPLTICLICLTLMWLEAVLGLCLGCEIHRFLVRRGWAKRDEDYEICANGACVVDART